MLRKCIQNVSSTVKRGDFGQGGDFGHPLLGQYKDSIS